MITIDYKHGAEVILGILLLIVSIKLYERIRFNRSGKRIEALRTAFAQSSFTIASPICYRGKRVEFDVIGFGFEGRVIFEYLSRQLRYYHLQRANTNGGKRVKIRKPDRKSMAVLTFNKHITSTDLEHFLGSIKVTARPSAAEVPESDTAKRRWRKEKQTAVHVPSESQTGYFEPESYDDTDDRFEHPEELASQEQRQHERDGSESPLDDDAHTELLEETSTAPAYPARPSL